MAVQVGRTVISFTIKFVQSEKEKLKSDISKVLDAKNKNLKNKQPVVGDEAQALQINNPQPSVGNNQTQQQFRAQEYPLEMQQTFAMNIPMENSNEKENENEPRQMD